MTRNEVRVSNAELELLQLLWNDSPLSASELAERLRPDRQWNITTVKTLLCRLVAKGAVSAEREGRRNLYRPAVAHEMIAGKQAGGLIDRLFGGRVSPFVAQLAEQRTIDPADLEELEALIRKLKQ